MKGMSGVIGALAAITLTPVAHADGGNQAALSRPFAEAGSPFVGQWAAHGENVTVNADGTGFETAQRGQLNFKMTGVQTSTTPWDTAYGNVVSGVLERGAFVTIQLVDGGKGMDFSAGGGDSGFPFCKKGANGAALNRFDCGA